MQLSGIIREKTGITLDEDEIAYIALHLGGALETAEGTGKPCARRAVLPQLLQYWTDSLADRISRRMQGKILLTNVFTKESLLDQLTGSALVISYRAAPQGIGYAACAYLAFFDRTPTLWLLNRKVEEINTQARREKLPP